MLRSKASWLSLSAFLFDLTAVAAAWLFAYLIRFNGSVPPDFMSGGLTSLVWVLPVYALMFHVFGLYRGLWVFASLPDLMRISKAVIGGGVIVMIGAVMFQPSPIIPRSVLPRLYKLADSNYASLHEYYVDGRPIRDDVFDPLTGTWKTILVGGLNKGGRGYYALDITNPTSPKALWEFTHSTTCFGPSGRRRAC